MPSSVCVDASVLVRFLVPGPLREAAIVAVARWRTDDVLMVAPTLCAYEVTSVLRRLVHGGQLTPDEGDRAFALFRALDVRYVHRPNLLTVAWEMARRYRQPRAYDAAYLAVAQVFGCDLWTADERLYRTVHADLPWVHRLGEAVPPAA